MGNPIGHDEMLMFTASPTLNAEVKLVLIVLALCADDQRCVRVSVKPLAELTELSAETVENALRQLVQYEILKPINPGKTLQEPVLCRITDRFTTPTKQISSCSVDFQNN